MASSASAPPEDRWRHRFSVLTAASVLVLIFIGGLVTSTGSGLSVPDWPLSYGKLMPPMEGGVFYEHGHRMAATLVGFLALVLASWTARVESRRSVRWLAWGGLAMVVLQGVLGGLTVLFLLPPAISIAHACLAQAFLCLTIALAYLTSNEWLRGQGQAPSLDETGLRPAATATASLAFLQLVLGAVMRHLGAGLAIPDFPLVFGGLIPPAATVPVLVHFAHRIGGGAVLGAVVWLLLRSRRAGYPGFLRLAQALLALVAGQVLLGGATVLMAKEPITTTLHVATGAAVLGLAFLLALRAHRLLRTPEAEPAALPSLAVS